MSTPVTLTIVSARGQEDDNVKALDAGADDYVSKSFGIDELRHASEQRFDAQRMRRVPSHERPPLDIWPSIWRAAAWQSGFHLSPLSTRF